MNRQPHPPMVQPKPGLKVRLPGERLAPAGLEDDRSFIFPTRPDDADVSFEGVELPVAEVFGRKFFERRRLPTREQPAHDRDDVQAVERNHVVDGVPEPDQRGNDGAGRGPVDEVELLAEAASDQRLDLLQRAECVESLRAPAI